MLHRSLVRPLGLLSLALGMVGLLGWLSIAPAAQLLAAVSPLPAPWLTPVVAYPTVLPTLPPTDTSPGSVVWVHFVLPSPLPTPTAIQDFTPPRTTLQLTGIQTTTGWYRSPVSVTFALTDAFGAGVTEYQLDHARLGPPALQLKRNGTEVLSFSLANYAKLL